MAGKPPFAWTPEIEGEIFSRLGRGESLLEICSAERDDWLPSETTFYKRLSSDSEFAENYARARFAQAHRENDEIRKIADAATPETVQVARLRIDARKWRASKMAPKVYGDKLELNARVDVTTQTKEQRDAAVAAASRADR